MAIINQNRKILFNTGVQIVGKIVSVLFGFLSVYLLTRYLGVKEYGEYTLVFAYLAFFGVIADFGLHLAMIKTISTYQGNKRKLIGSYFIIRILLVFLSFILACVSLLLVPYPLSLKLFILIGLLGACIGYVSGFGNAIFQSKLQIDLITYIDIIGKIITLLIIYIFIQIGLNIYFILFSIFIGNSASFILSTYFLIKENAIFFDFDLKIAKKLILVSIPIGITALFSLLYFKIDTILLSFLKNSSDVAYYGVSYKIFENILIFWGFYMTSAYPILASRTRKIIEFNIVLKQTVIIACVSSLVIILIGYFYAPLVVKIIAGNDFILSSDSLRILLFSIPLFFINNILYHVFLIKDRMWTLIKILIGSLLINIILNIIFIPRFSYIGASYTTLVTEVFTFSCYILLFLNNYRKI